MTRVISWFSCGAASAVATKLAIAENKKGDNLPLVIAYTEVIEEHPDNKRFLAECENWFDQEIVILKNDKYHRSIYEVFEKTRYLVGAAGARCTVELKKNVRKAFELPNDRQVFGYTIDEQHRVDRFIDANNDVDIWPILVEKGLTKSDCLAMLKNADIELPVMYKMGYRNNNCIGCVKGQAGYWNKIRVDFPEVFERMAQMEEKLGRTICKIEKCTKGKRTLKRITLRELPPDQGNYKAEPNIECGIFCLMAEDDYTEKGTT
jgi:hypothetical protein